MEFHVWTDLIQQSRGALHIFLSRCFGGLVEPERRADPD
jgi:hypothetical protein